MFSLSLFILSERDSMSREGQKERGRDRIPNSLHNVSTEPDMELELQNSEIVTWAEIGSWMLNQLSHPGSLICISMCYFPFAWRTTFNILCSAMLSVIILGGLDSFLTHMIWLVFSWILKRLSSDFWCFLSIRLSPLQYSVLRTLAILVFPACLVNLMS